MRADTGYRNEKDKSMFMFRIQQTWTENQFWAEV